MSGWTEATLRTAFCERLGLAFPLIQAPMAGGASNPLFAAEACNAGALGSLGGAYLEPAELKKAIRETRTLTDRPFAVNLFAPSPELVLDAARITAARAATSRYRRELGLEEEVQVAAPFCPDFNRQLAVVLREKPAVFSFTFGMPSRDQLAELRELGIITVGTATCLEDALELESAGVDAVVAQGYEAGAHRGLFSMERKDERLGTSRLASLLASALQIPVIAAGGIMDGRGIVAALGLGAQAAQLGTAFLACDEAGISPAYRTALLEGRATPTCFTRAFSGRWARGLENRFLREMAGREDAILPFPAQNAFTRDIRNKAAVLGRPEFLSLWAGQGVAAIRVMKVGELVRVLKQEALEALRQ